jgi:AraC-like DNA-binding protein
MLQSYVIQAPTYISLTLAFILLLSSKANRARFFLGIFMFAVFMIFLSHFIYFNHWKGIYIYFDLMFIFGSLSIFPIYCWYIKLLTFQSRIDVKDLKHLIPAFTMLIATLVTYLFMSKQLRDVYVNDYLYGNGRMENAPLLIKVQLILCYILQIIYFVQIVYSFIKIRSYILKYSENIANYYSNLENMTLEWPKIILYSFVVSSLFTIYTNFMGRSFFDKWPIMLLFTCIAYSLFLFILGHLGNMQNNTIDALEANTILLPTTDLESINQKKIKAQLLNLFEKEKVFKQKDLKITDIVSRLNTNRTYISTFINNEYDCSFSTFVNQFRVEEAKEALLDAENSNLCLEHISVHVGFGSLHTFIRVFKEIEGTTPGNFRESAIAPRTDKMVV